MRPEWGFACWVQYGETVLLFDTGGNGSVLLDNMSALGLDPQDIDLVVLSHIHGDHTGGMERLLGSGGQKVAPCHCTGEEAMGVLATEFGDDYLTAGVGWIIDLMT